MSKEIKSFEIKEISEKSKLYLEAAFAGFQIAISPKTSKSITKKEGSHNYVTPGDIMAQKEIIKIIKTKFPNTVFMGEESDLKIEDPENKNELCVIDPIDGTFNFAHDIPYWAVSVGGVEDGIVMRGAIVNQSGDTFVSEIEKGSYKNGKRIGVSQVQDLKSARVDTDTPSDDIQRVINYSILEKLCLYGNVRGSLVGNVARVAAGESDLYYCAGFGGPWDITAGISLIQEAGGVIYDLLNGRDLTGEKNNFLAKSIAVGNRTLVESLIKETRPVINSLKNRIRSYSLKK